MLKETFYYCIYHINVLQVYISFAPISPSPMCMFLCVCGFVCVCRASSCHVLPISACQTCQMRARTHHAYKDLKSQHRLYIFKSYLFRNLNVQISKLNSFVNVRSPKYHVNYTGSKVWMQALRHQANLLFTSGYKGSYSRYKQIADDVG